jgi:hypothetical protein
MRYIIAFVLVSFLGMNVHAQGEPPTSTPPANGMDNGAGRDPAKAKKKKKKHSKKHKTTNN